jgi:DNA invertase Pin-like site-specific DNA recombinase
MNEAFSVQPNRASPIRCAIYTRKSTEEGLDQEFNSLDAQREAAEAYIQSQKHLGWILVPGRYDDGGFSGGNLERPALQQLLKDIGAGQVDCVVVYKVDRLSRSLLDFSRLMDRFDQRSVSFVAVTQQFNTTTSLGRLTLNILLSFAQFEREIISERTRDKMSAARKKGKWVGGTPVLGYDVDPAGGRLVVNEKEAKQVRDMFALYQQHRSLAAAVTELDRRKWKTKSRTSQRGIKHIGRPFTKASLTHLLTNATYTGNVNYRGGVYPGEHPAIVDPQVWEDVNRDFTARERTKPPAARKQQDALLAGLLFCKDCQQPMRPTYSAKGGRRFRYYVCQRARQQGWQSCATKSVSALRVEESLVSQLRVRLSREEARRQLGLSERDWQAFLHDPAGLVSTLVHAVRYQGRTGTVSVELRRVGGSSEAMRFDYRVATSRRALPSFPADQRTESTGPPAQLARVVALAHLLEAQVRSGHVQDYEELARLRGISPARIAQIVILSQLAPVIQEYVLFLSAEYASLITEIELREIARDIRWDKQLVAFEKLISRHS